MAGAVKIKGGRELTAALRRTEPEVAKALRQDLREAGARIALVGASKAPRRTGELQRSIRPYVTARGISIGSTLPYAGVVHWGGTISPRGAPITFEPRPFLRDAVEDTADWIINTVADSFDSAARRAGWK